jgi:hypothetical protein
MEVRMSRVLWRAQGTRGARHFRGIRQHPARADRETAERDPQRQSHHHRLKRRWTRRACRGVARSEGLQGDGVLRAWRLQGNERQEEGVSEGAAALNSDTGRRSSSSQRTRFAYVAELVEWKAGRPHGGIPDSSQNVTAADSQMWRSGDFEITKSTPNLQISKFPNLQIH